MNPLIKCVKPYFSNSGTSLKHLIMASIFQRAIEIISALDKSVYNAFRSHFFPENLVPALVSLPNSKQPTVNHQNLLELLKDSLLWAVPKKRRSIEKRRSRRFGHPKYVYKMLLPKTNILICPKCASYHEAGLLCPTCYNEVKKETEEIKSKISAELGIGPIESEVVVLYSGEKNKSNKIFYEGKRIIEMEKERPKIFSDNLLQKSTQTKSENKNVITSGEASEVK